MPWQLYRDASLCLHFFHHPLRFTDLQNEMAKLKHRVQVAEEERDIATEKEKETKLRVLATKAFNISFVFRFNTKDLSYWMMSQNLNFCNFIIRRITV